MINSISFGSKIKFLSCRDFENVKNAQNANSSNWVSDPWNKTIINDKAGTDDIASCIAGGLTNPDSKEVVLSHYAPIYSSGRNFNKVENDIKNNTDKMKAFTPRLGGLVIGGKAASSADMNYQSSMKLADNFKKLYGNFNTDYSTFVGQTRYGTATDVTYWGDEDTWFVNCHEYGNKQKDIINSAKDIKDNYSYINVSDKDNVYIGNQEVDKNFLKSNGNTNPYESSIYNIKESEESIKNRAKVYANFSKSLV